MNKKLVSALYVRNFIFGVEDSLVSTVGLLSGIAAANVPKSTIFITGMILIFVEAFSMGVGSFLSEQSAVEFIDKNANVGKTIIAAFIMFISYFATGFIPLLPYTAFNIKTAFPLSIIFSLLALAILGFISARLFKTAPAKSVLRMLFVGGMAIAVGVAIGYVLQKSGSAL